MPQAAEENPEVIILEMQPGADANQQAMFAMLLLQLLSALQGEGESVDVQFVAPQSGERI